MDINTFSLEHVSTPTGGMAIITDSDECLRALDWDDHEPRMLRLLRLHYGDDAVAVREVAPFSAASRALQAYFEGDIDAFLRFPTATGGTIFQRAVWAALRRIPAGQTVSYGRLADNIGNPKAVRAVGRANGANPISIAVPCHRVIGADATLTGYGGGVERKRWLLAHEARYCACAA